ncbi:MAG: hypothetical protein H6553_05635 [Chitinophagales bacterium]|nr:hypothetical protein [Chitinophagales bacterium]
MKNIFLLVMILLSTQFVIQAEENQVCEKQMATLYNELSDIDGISNIYEENKSDYDYYELRDQYITIIDNCNYGDICKNDKLFARHLFWSQLYLANLALEAERFGEAEQFITNTLDNYRLINNDIALTEDEKKEIFTIQNNAIDLLKMYNTNADVNYMINTMYINAKNYTDNSIFTDVGLSCVNMKLPTSVPFSKLMNIKSVFSNDDMLLLDDYAMYIIKNKIYEYTSVDLSYKEVLVYTLVYSAFNKIQNNSLDSVAQYIQPLNEICVGLPYMFPAITSVYLFQIEYYLQQKDYLKAYSFLSQIILYFNYFDAEKYELDLIKNYIFSNYNLCVEKLNRKDLITNK